MDAIVNVLATLVVAGPCAILICMYGHCDDDDVDDGRNANNALQYHISCAQFDVCSMHTAMLFACGLTWQIKMKASWSGATVDEADHSSGPILFGVCLVVCGGVVSVRRQCEQAVE